MEREKPEATAEPPPMSETPEFKSVTADRDEWKARAGRLTAELDKAKLSITAMTKRLRESDAEERLKERDALRRQMGDAMSRAAALERERDAWKAEVTTAQRCLAAARREAELSRQTIELVQAGRDAAQRDLDMLAIKANQAIDKIAALTFELEEAKKAAKSPATAGERARK